MFVIVSTGPNPIGSLPIATLAGGVVDPVTTRGNVCVDFTTGTVFLGFTNATGVYQHMLNLNPGTRAIINQFRPMDLWYQGFVVNAANPLIELHGTGCGVTHL